jgi:hypothetical protein
MDCSFGASGGWCVGVGVASFQGLWLFWCGSPGVKTPWFGDCGLGRVGVYEDADGLDGWVA